MTSKKSFLLPPGVPHAKEVLGSPKTKYPSLRVPFSESVDTRLVSFAHRRRDSDYPFRLARGRSLSPSHP